MHRILTIFVAAAAFAPQVSRAAPALPAVTLTIGQPNAAATLYGPADMVCDLDKCHMFLVPGLPKNATVVFQMPNLHGQSRIDLRRCFNVCHGSVLGYLSDETGHRTPDQRNPAITITPVEIRLEMQAPGQ